MGESSYLCANEIYKHYKGGCYTIIAVGTCEQTGVDKVVYQSHDTKIMWIRDYDEFVGYVGNDGEQIKRFEYQGIINMEQFTYGNIMSGKLT